MLGVSGKGITMHWCLRGDDDTDGIGIDNVLDENGSCQFYGILNGSWKWKMKQFLIAEWERVLMKTKKGKVNRIWIRVFLNCWIFILLYLSWYSCLNNMCFVSGPSHAWQE